MLGWRGTLLRSAVLVGIVAGLALDWTALALVSSRSEARRALFTVRLLAFVLPIVGIVDKNRRGAAGP